MLPRGTRRIVATATTSTSPALPGEAAAPHGTAVGSTIPSFLGRVRQVLYRHEARRATWYALAALAGIAVLMPLSGEAFGSSRTTAIALLAFGGLVAILVVIAAVVMGIVAPRKKWDADRELARWVGERKHDVASDLLSSVELANAEKRVGAPSPELVAALVAATADRVERIDPDGLMPDDLRRPRRWAIAVVALNVALIAIAPAVIADGWRSLLASPPAPFDGAQLSSVPLVGDLQATLVSPPYARRPPVVLASSSGDLRGLPGTLVTLKAKVLVPATSVELVIEPPLAASNAAAGVHVAAKLDGDQVTAELKIEKTSRYRFSVTSTDGARKLETSPRSIEAELDQAPTVTLMAPSEPLDVTNLRRVELAYVLEDDFGLTSAELVWVSGKDRGKKPLALGVAGSARAQNKVLWDIAELQVPSGGEVTYWVEAKDNDTVGGPNLGKSHEFHLRVVSPRERHEETLGRQQDLAEKLLRNLGARLVLGDDQSPREELSRGLKEAVVELGSIGGAYEKDPHASDALRKALAGVRDRLDKLATTEQHLLPKQKGGAITRGMFAGLDPRIVAELEDDAIVLADWLDRERVEGLLDISDEIAAHQKRLHELLAEYQRTKDPRLMDEIERELKALDRSFAELEKHRRGMAEDVLDQYVHRDAVQAQQGENCIEEVRKLVRAGKAAEAQAKLEQCQSQHDKAQGSLENSLNQMRGDKFSDEQKKLDEVMNELADVSKDQDDIAAESNRIFEQYAQKADEVAREHRREAAKKVTALVEKLRKRINDINESGLTPFAKEELDLVEHRIADVEKMVGDGDLAEALAMAHQAKQSLDTIAGELEAAINDDPKSKWADATQDALDGVGRARPVAKELIDLLQSLSPRPDQIMSADDQRALERLRRREAMNKDRAKRLSDKTKQMSGELPGDTGPEMGKKLGSAIDQMGMADDRMKGKDPSGAREATRAAADALQKARDRARSAARQAQENSSSGNEPIRIPGADEYKAPEEFREQLLEGQKKKAPDEYKKQVEQYFKELSK